ncbi:hypothetical protein GFJ91_23855, partial [Salmonella enterica subsp. enterica serovar Enteritidis]|nr:hypothetical protein [Salmonella enterica subsp. enterica serovar Enteritidis]
VPGLLQKNSGWRRMAILSAVIALVNFESVSEHVAMQHNTWMVGVGMVVVFGLLNAIGVEVFGKGGNLRLHHNKCQ